MRRAATVSSPTADDMRFARALDNRNAKPRSTAEASQIRRRTSPGPAVAEAHDASTATAAAATSATAIMKSFARTPSFTALPPPPTATWSFRLHKTGRNHPLWTPQQFTREPEEDRPQDVLR